VLLYGASHMAVKWGKAAGVPVNVISLAGGLTTTAVARNAARHRAHGGYSSRP
jgi:hypothetical protein